MKRILPKQLGFLLLWLAASASASVVEVIAPEPAPAVNAPAVSVPTELTKTITLNHRNAKEVVTQLASMASKNKVTMTHFDQHIVLQGSPKNIVLIKGLILKLDTKPKQLRIQVMNAARGKYLAGARLHTHLARTHRHYHTRSQQEELVSSTVVLNGKVSFIQTGQSIPIVEQLVRYPQNTDSIDSVSQVQYKDISKGFYVKPQMRKDYAIIAISPFHDQLADEGGGKIKLSRSATTLTVPYHRWIELNKVSEVEQQHKTLKLYQTLDNEQQITWIKVEPIS